MKRLVVVVAVAVAVAVSTVACSGSTPPKREQYPLPGLASKYFPPGVFWGRDDGIDSSANLHANELHALEEPSLLQMRSDPSATAYRLNWSRTFKHPVAVRITPTTDGATVVSKMSYGAGGYYPGKLVEHRTAHISLDEFANFEELFEATGFWDLPSRYKPNPHLKDGTSWVVEAVSNGRYHVVWQRPTKDEGPIVQIGNRLLELGQVDRNVYYLLHPEPDP